MERIPPSEISTMNDSAAPSSTTEEAPAGFDSFGLDPRILEATSALGFDVPTPIQSVAMPALLQGRDIVGRARTGSGKTAAFGLPLLDRVKEGGTGVRALVMTPTRELALQVTSAIASYAKRLPRVKLLSIYGGAPYGPQFNGLQRGATVVVGTPGRLIDHLDRGSLDLSTLEMLVLDEADEMLRMGFLEDVEKLLNATPATRQVALFSATMPPAIRRVANAHLKNPVDAAVETNALSTDHIEQRMIEVPNKHKLDALLRVLQAGRHPGTLVFARTRASCAELSDALTRRGTSVDALHGDLSQAQRERVLSMLRASRLEVVVATDVAARGIDVDHITQVINFDLPMDAEGYTHRIGRTGRAGRKGLAISFVTPQERRRFRFIESKLKLKVEEMSVPTDASIRRQLQESFATLLQERAVDDGKLRHAKRWLEEIRPADRPEGEQIDTESLLAAALSLLAERDKISLEPVGEDRPPHWARPSRPSRDQGGRDHGGRDAPPRERGDHSKVNEVELFLPVGKNRGLRVGDIVGALANELDIPGHAIGKVTLLPHQSFVGLSREDAERAVKEMPNLTLRGHEVPVTIARPRAKGADAPHGGTRPPWKQRGPKPSGERPRWKKGPAKGPQKTRGPR